MVGHVLGGDVDSGGFLLQNGGLLGWAIILLLCWGQRPGQLFMACKLCLPRPTSLWEVMRNRTW